MYEVFISSLMLVGTSLCPGVNELIEPSYARERVARARRIPVSDVQVLHERGVLLDELAARLDHLAHERGEHELRLGLVLELHLEQSARLRIHGRAPQLFGVHFAQALVALDGHALLAQAL